ncbi:MAG: C25 family cysteine peptidase, partial [Thermoplasmatota archaeon]
MQKRIQKTVQKMILVITILGLLTGTFNTVVVSQPTKSPLPTEESNYEKEKRIVNTETEEGSSPEESYYLQYTIGFSKEDLSFDTLMGYDLVTMNEGSYLTEIGKPMIPVKHIMIALPNGMKVTNIRVLTSQKQPIQGLYTIYPAQRPLPVGETYDSILDVRPNRATYTSPLPYPARLVSLGKQTDLAGQSMIEITIYPLHYLPLQKKLILTQSISFVIEGVGGNICRDFLPQTISENGRMMYEQMVRGMVINPETVELCTSPSPQPMGVGPGDYDYVIITQESWVSAFQLLADWKTQKGVPATIVTTNWIYNSGGYSGTDIQKIRAFVQDAYTNWGTIYVLLGGDINVVPCHYRTFYVVDPDPVPNDAYYADFDSDWVCEVNVGRASVTGSGNSTGQIGNFINKIMTYETNPPLTNYAKNAGFFGFDLDSITYAEQCKINIKNAYIPTSWTVTTVYDSQTGNHQTNVINALNAGQNLVNHADHSNNDCMGTGYVNHDWLIYSSDMDTLTNGNKQTILYSMGCDPAAFDVSNCIAEHFVRNSNGGGIAFIGNSRYGWYEWATYDTLSMGYDIHFFQSLFQENLYHLGAAFSDHKNDGYQEYPGDEWYKYCFTELTLLGDPELPVWTENPSTFVVSHPQTIPLASFSFTVHVETTSGNNVQNAYVCLRKGDEIYERGFTNSAGDATFTITPETGGSMDVTVTKQNYIPSESSAQVIEDNIPPNQPSSPNPANDATNVPIYSDLSWIGGDPNPGDTVTYDVYFGTSSTPPKVGNNQSTTTYDLGTMNYVTTYYWKIVAWDSFGESTAGPLWSFTTKVNSPPVFGNPSPVNGSTGNSLSFTWSIPVNDPEGNNFSWTIQCSNGQANSGTSASNGTKSLALSGLVYSTTYKVWVNATDSGGSGIYTRKWYTFTTKASLPPVFGTPSPANSSTNNPLSFNWSIPINDPEGDVFSWTIQCSNGQTNSGTGATNGTKSLALSGLDYLKTYTVWVNATDPTGSGLYTRKWYTFSTIVNLPPVFGTSTPGNGSTNNPLNLTWSIPINDPDGDTFSWTIQCSNEQVNSGTGTTNGTKSLT